MVWSTELLCTAYFSLYGVDIVALFNFRMFSNTRSSFSVGGGGSLISCNELRAGNVSGSGCSRASFAASLLCVIIAPERPRPRHAILQQKHNLSLPLSTRYAHQQPPPFPLPDSERRQRDGLQRLQAKRDALLRHLRAADELQQQRERVLVRMIVQNFGIGLPMQQLGPRGVHSKKTNQKSTGSVTQKKSQN